MADLVNIAGRPRVLVVCGPTASGKTGLGVALAQRFNGEIISADSMQIYRGLSVGTAKVTREEAQGVLHHLVDICEPEQAFSVADYVALADSAIRDITARGKLPIVVGGTGLYISSLLQGVRFVEQPPVDDLRAALEAEAEALGPLAMWQKLEQVDPQAAAAIHPNNRKRVLRALEIYRQTGTRMSEQVADSLPPESPYDALVIGLRCADRARLYERIDVRVDAMMDRGILREAELVWKNRTAYSTAAQAIGYKEFFGYFTGETPLEACVEELKRASRRYAKRQLTWFGRMPQVQWLELDTLAAPQDAARQMVEAWLSAADS